MLDKIINTTGIVIHAAFIPVVRAEQHEIQRSDDETVWDRLKAVFKTDEYNGISPEINNFFAMVQTGSLIGVVLGGCIHAKNQYMYFMENAIASKYKWHMDAKADLSNRMIKASIRGAAVWGVKSLAIVSTYAFLVNFIPVVRGEHSWIEYVISSFVSGTIAGNMLSDRDALGFERTTKVTRITYKQLCLLRGAGFGLAFGILSGAYTQLFNTHAPIDEMRKWEKYWKQRQQAKEATKNKID